MQQKIDNLAGQEIEFSAFGLTLTGKRWGRPGGIPTFGLHGWLDNANTFDNLAPLLPELDLIALDFAGHGRSSHRPAGAHYHALADMQDVLCIADQLGWAEFNLIGHSMGAAIASELSALFTERVTRAIMIDGFLATGGISSAERLDQNRLAIAAMLDAHSKQVKIYPDVTTLAERVTQATDQSFAAASVLVSRGHKTVEQGVTWRTDPRIRFPTPLRMTKEQINELVARSKTPSLLLVAEQGDTWYQSEIDERVQHHTNLQLVHLEGPHHIHLEPEYVSQVAAHIRDFFAS